MKNLTPKISQSLQSHHYINPSFLNRVTLVVDKCIPDLNTTSDFSTTILSFYSSLQLVARKIFFDSNFDQETQADMQFLQETLKTLIPDKEMDIFALRTVVKNFLDGQQRNLGYNDSEMLESKVQISALNDFLTATTPIEDLFFQLEVWLIFLNHQDLFPELCNPNSKCRC